MKNIEQVALKCVPQITETEKSSKAEKPVKVAGTLHSRLEQTEDKVDLGKVPQLPYPNITGRPA